MLDSLTPLYQPPTSENERKRIVSIITDKTKPRAYKHCMVDPSCNRKIVKGHLVPRSWLKKISTKDEVIPFASFPVYHHNRQVQDMEGDAVELFRQNVKPVHRNNVFVRYFTCQHHESYFGHIDDPDCDVYDSRNKNWMAYKAIIAQKWNVDLFVRAWSAVREEQPMNQAFQALVQHFRQCAIGLDQYERQIKKCLEPSQCSKCKGGQCKVVKHVVRHIPGNPVVAVSEFSQGVRTKIDPVRGEFTYIANPGWTVFPDKTGHYVIFHYFAEDEKIEVMQIVSQNMQRLHGRKLQALISGLILYGCENIAVNPATWDRTRYKRQRAIVSRFVENNPSIVGSKERIVEMDRRRYLDPLMVPNPQQINLFSLN